MTISFNFFLESSGVNLIFFLFSISDRIISVKFDCSTKHNRPTLGMNIQYIKNAEIIVRNIGMTEMKDRSTGVNLKNTIMGKLEEFAIHIGRIYSFSIDNGANVIKSAKLLHKEANDDDDDTSDDYLSDDDSEDDDEESNSGSDVDENDDLDDSAFLEMETWTESVENVVTSFGQNIDNDNFTVTIRCASHSIQLSVVDTIKTTKIRNLLSKSRKVVKKLRTSTMRLQLQKENGKKPIIDSKIRWNSQYNMLFRLVELKPFCFKYENVTPELKLSDEDWIHIDNLLEALKPIKILTRQVQSVQMTLSDFYGHYIKCRLLLSKNTSNEFAQLLAKSMNMRQSFFTNNILLAAVYLDPRYQVLLSQEDKKNAQKHLAFLYKKIHNTDDSTQSNTVPDTQEEAHQADHEVEFESFLKQMERQTNTRSNVGRLTRGKSLTHSFNT